jgi:hypothetical protein
MWSHLYHFLSTNHLLNSTFFLALTTITVGTVALYIYRKQKRDEKKDAATIILTEIKKAAETLPGVKHRFQKSGLLDEDIFLVHEESWSKYKFLFVNLLSEGEWTAIDDFYKNCNLYDDAVELNNSYFSQDASHIRDGIYKYVYKEISEYYKANSSAESMLEKIPEDVSKQLINFRELYIKDALKQAFYRPAKPVNDANLALSNLNHDILLSSVGTKLNEIANPRPYFMRLISR